MLEGQAPLGQTRERQIVNVLVDGCGFLRREDRPKGQAGVLPSVVPEIRPTSQGTTLYLGA